MYPNVYRMSLVRWIQQKRQEHEVCDGKKTGFKDSQAVWKSSRLDCRSGSSERKSSRFSRSGSVPLFWFEAAYQTFTRKALECSWLLLCFDRWQFSLVLAGVAAEEGTGRFLARGGGDAHWRFVLPAPRY